MPQKQKIKQANPAEANVFILKLWSRPGGNPHENSITDLSLPVSGLLMAMSGLSRLNSALPRRVPLGEGQTIEAASARTGIQPARGLPATGRGFVHPASPHGHYSFLVGWRRPQRKRRATRSRGNTAVFVSIFVWMAIPVLATVVLQSLSTKPSLSDMVVREAVRAGGPRVVGWPDLEVADGRERVKLLGYMMDNGVAIQNEDATTGFLLLPEAGTVLHPAHRIPEQMVEVEVRKGASCRFEFRRLVWVEGLLRHRRDSVADGDAPVHFLDDALVEKADPADISAVFSHPR